mmetsp:Transcript_25193/g.51219  ORF Transcript_25193/g.51219 Transcript_25193/m.51219 type:complete len:294 (+) Transcript_25193:2-883(+)
MIKKLEVIGVLSRENLSWGGGGPREELAIAHLGFLFRNYRAGVWYWEVVELLRKLTFNALMVFIFPGSRAQLICGFLIAALFMLASAKFSPHKDKRVATLHFVASIALCVTLQYAICVRLLEAGPAATGEAGLREVMSWMAVILNGTVLAFPFVMYVFNSSANPFILWSRLCSRAANTDHDDYTLQRAASRQPRVTVHGEITSPMSPVLRSQLPGEVSAMRRELMRSPASTPADGNIVEAGSAVPLMRCVPCDGEGVCSPAVMEEGDERAATMAPVPQPAVIVTESTPAESTE